MAPKTRFAGKTNKEGAPEKKKKNESAAEKKKAAAEKKKAAAVKKKAAAVKKKAAAVKRRRVAVKKKRDAAKKKTETAEKKRKQDSSSSESSSNPTKRRRTASSPEQHSDPDHSPAPSAELLSQDDREGTPSPSFPIEPQKAPTQTPSEAENPLQAPITSNNREDPNRESHSPEAAINNEAQRTIGSNNSDSNPPEAAIGSATIDNDAPRTAGEENMAVEPMRPVGFFFKPSDYWTACKLSSRCHQHDFLETIKDFKESEKSWFENHPQFKHLFHMDCCEKRKVQGLWMLLLRCMHTGKERQAWFGVNGVPIRYSIREHALLSGLYCGSYPENYPIKGKMKFATKHFKHLQKKTKEKNRKKQGLRVTEADVLEKLEKMEADDGSDERLKMAVLYFLTRVIRGRKRNAYFIEPFILQAVDDLDFCNKFPWGRYTFDDCMKEIFHLRDHFAKGLPENNMQWTFPGFVIPLEILAFECIPVLRESFRDPDPNCLPDCPRMCKWKYKRTGTTGFALEEIYKALGNTKVISSTLKPQGDELDLLYEIMDEGSVEDVELQDDSDKADIAVDGWNRILIEPEGKIFWEDLFEMDVRTRPTTQQQSEPHGIFEGQEEERVCEEPEAGGEAGRESVKELELRLNKRMDDGFALRDETIRLLAARVKELEQDKIQRENWSFQFGEYETCEASGGKGRDNMGNGNEDGEAVAEKDGEKQVEEEAEKNGTKEAEKDGAKEAETTPEDAEGEEEADKDGKNSESDAVTAAVHTPLPTETTPEDVEGEEEAAKEAYEVAGNEDEVGQKEGETEADKEGETEEGKTDVEDSPSTLQVMAEAAEKLEKEVDDKAAAEKAAAEKAAADLAAAEKAASDKEKVGDQKETRPKRTHKPSRPLRSPYQKN